MMVKNPITSSIQPVFRTATSLTTKIQMLHHPQINLI